MNLNDASQELIVKSKYLGINSYFFSALLGNLAMTIWFIPFIALMLHRIRGVNFKKCKNIYIGRNVLIDNRYPELVTLGDDVWITANTTLLTHSYYSRYQSSILGKEESLGQVVIENGVFIGSGSIICPNVIIGRGSYVAAGSVVTHDVPSDVYVAGNPAKVIKKFRKDHTESGSYV
jgi:acetyltransferase-like isoleucine patch superfamily enzyme